jgi:polyisoprenoid-binding protein YceI
MSAARCHVFTEKDGLLSRMAHDLRIRVDRFDVKVEGDGDARTVTATFDPSSLVVESALLEDGADNPRALSASDRKKIEETIRSEVLEARKHSEIRFRSTRVEESGGAMRIEGELSLHGRTQTLTLRAVDAGEAWETEATLHQPDFGITPYRAALGALKIKPHVRVKIRVPKG